MGYLIAVALQFIMISSLLRYVAFAASFSIGSYLFAIAIIDDIECDLFALDLDECVGSKAPQSEIFYRFNEIIRSHSVRRELSMKISQKVHFRN